MITATAVLGTTGVAGGRSVPRPSSPIEDHRPLAARAHQPLPPTGVAQPERAAADGAGRHDRAVARADGLLPRGDRIADRLLLRGLELRMLAAHDAIRMTTFPNCSPLASRSNAARASPSAYTLSIGGRSRPARKCSTTASSSASLPIVEPRMLHWFQNRRRTSVVTIGPDVPPHVTNRPRRPSAPSDCAHVASPTESTTTSTPRFCVLARISFPTSMPRWLIVASAPSATARASFASLPEVTVT